MGARPRTRTKVEGGIHGDVSALLRMGLDVGKVVRLTCLRGGIRYPHDGIVVVGPPAGAATVEDAELMQCVRVIHFCTADLSSEVDDGAPDAPTDELRVRETSLAWFLQLGAAPEIVEIVARPPAFPPDVIVQRARSFLGAKDYVVYKRNCQSFVTHCVYGVAFTEAIQRAGMYIGGALVTLGICVVLAARELARTPWQ